MAETKENYAYCGYVAIVGRPNVGKSTLLNHLLQKKISITARKPQTTRHCILGVLTEDDHQAIFIDTPGLHSNQKKALNRYMNKVAAASLNDVNLILFVIEAMRWTKEDELVLEKIKKTNCRTVLIINKVDLVEDKKELLPFIEKCIHRHEFHDVFPICAKDPDDTRNIKKVVMDALPMQSHLYPDDQLTDRTERFLAAEIVREKLIRFLGDELPYELSVTTESFKEEKNILHISMIIWVERQGQKVIVIGRKGLLLKKIGTRARNEMEIMFKKKVYLNLWVKIKSGWTDDEKSLKQFGYE